MNITVVIATYNGAKFIEEQIRSIISQSVVPSEIIVSDDNSSDETVEIILKVLREFPNRYVVLKNEKKIGFSGNFNRTLGYVLGDIIFFSDQDDVWFQNKIELQVKNMACYPCLVMCDMRAVNEDLETLFSSVIKEGGSSIEDYCYGCSMAISKALLEIIYPVPYHIVQHDVWINYCANILSSKIVIEKTLQLYRRHQSNVTRSMFANQKSIADHWRLAREFRYRASLQAKLYHEILCRLEARNTLASGDRAYCQAIKHARLQYERFKTRIAGTTVERIANPAYYINQYRELGIGAPRFLKDTLILNDVFQRKQNVLTNDELFRF
jgi:glycosyltransferase involved in cell wall biosynthesis